MAEVPRAPIPTITDYAGRSLLTAREKQITTDVAEGLSNREIAQQLHVSENTIKKALLRIFEKLGISNRVELVLYVFAQAEKFRTQGSQQCLAEVRTISDCKSLATG